MKKNVVVIAGGNSSEYGVSIKSGHHVFSEVDGERYNKYLMILQGRVWQVDIDGKRYDVDKNDFSFMLEGQKIALILPTSPFMECRGRTECCRDTWI